MSGAEQPTTAGGRGRARTRAANAPQVDPIFVDEPTAAALVSLSEPTLQKLVREGDFPKPRRISAGRAAYLFREVLDWAERRPVSDLLPPRNAGKRRPTPPAEPIAP